MNAAATDFPPALPDHPLAELFPLMGAQDLAHLAQSIAAEGLKAPITLHDGQILDGRNRYRACRIAEVEPRFREFPADSDPLAFVLAANLHRRHLTTSQRAVIAAKIACLPNGGDRSSEAAKQSANLQTAPSAAKAAKQLSVSERLVAEARRILHDEAQTRAVEAGEKTVHAAAAEMKAAAKAGKRGPKPARDNSNSGDIRRDATGYPIPEELWERWERKAEVLGLLQHVSGARAVVRAAVQSEDILYAPTNINGVLADLNNAYTLLQLSVPYAVCTTCQGRAVETCRFCKGRGFISKHHYEHCVPAELKEIRRKGCV
jgi:ParB-like chromosome segregation protein Spo0J